VIWSALLPRNLTYASPRARLAIFNAGNAIFRPSLLSPSEPVFHSLLDAGNSPPFLPFCDRKLLIWWL
jgi:hypothetical protein